MLTINSTASTTCMTIDEGHSTNEYKNNATSFSSLWLNKIFNNAIIHVYYFVFIASTVILMIMKFKEAAKNSKSSLKMLFNSVISTL